MDKIDEVGYMVWEEYYRLLTRRIGVTPKRGGHNYWDDKKYRIFRKIAQICIDNNMDPTDFITANLASIDASHYIRPEDFTKPEALERYKRHNNDSNPAFSWAIQVGMLTDLECRCVPKYFKDEIDILSDYETPFMPWFRLSYCTPFNEGLFKRFGELAWAQLREDRKLRKVCRNHSAANVEELERRFGRFGDIIGGYIHECVT